MPMGLTPANTWFAKLNNSEKRRRSDLSSNASLSDEQFTVDHVVSAGSLSETTRAQNHSDSEIRRGAGAGVGPLGDRERARLHRHANAASNERQRIETEEFSDRGSSQNYQTEDSMECDEVLDWDNLTADYSGSGSPEYSLLLDGECHEVGDLEEYSDGYDEF